MGAAKVLSAALSLCRWERPVRVGVVLEASKKGVPRRLGNLAGIVRGVKSVCTDAPDLPSLVCVQHEDTALRHFMRRAKAANEALVGRVSQDCRL